MTELPSLGLYAITSDAVCANEARLLTAVEAALRGGAALLQYRDKHNGVAIRERLAGRLLNICRAAHVPLIINDDVDLALAIGADGVHVGLSDCSPEQARAKLGPAAIVGVTCSGSLPRALAAEAAGASYVAFGAFFASSTKPAASLVSLDLLRQARTALRLPICAIGGIRPESGGALVRAGASYLAAIAGVFDTLDPEEAARSYADAFGHGVDHPPGGSAFA